MARHTHLPDSGPMQSITEDLALSVIQQTTEPAALLAISLVLLAVFSGVAGRAVLYLETWVSARNLPIRTRRDVGKR